jgi:putative ABC transport system permease protein
MFSELIIPIKLAFRSIRANIGRTAASLLGIVIGVASVILVLSFGMGIKQYLVDQVSSFGTDIMQIETKVPNVSKTSAQNAGGQAGGAQITTFKLEDAEKVAELSNVGAWYAMIISQQIVSYVNQNKQSIILGVTASVTQADEKTEVETGEMFTEDDDRSLRQAAVLGSEVKTDFFGEEEAVGKKIKIKGQSYEVIGVLKPRGATGIFNFDNTIYLPLRTVQKKLNGVDYIQTAVFKIKNMDLLDFTILDATDVMRSQHDITDPDDDDFAVNSIVELLNILDKVFKYVNILLIALTSISLLVGGVGIMNVMYVSVTERTFEIGLKKSVGARKGNVLIQFLFEAVFITMLGGIIGLILSFIIAKIGGVVVQNFGFTLNFSIPWWAAAIGIGFSAATGIIFGYFPARKASQLTPMDALRKE